MKLLLHVFLVCLLVLSGHLHAEAVNGVAFTCEAIPQSNINGVPSPSLLRATLTNVTNKTMVMKYRIISTSTDGRTFTSPEEGKSLPVRDSYHVEYTVFNKVNFADEFPKTCKFVEVQVCPAYPAKLAKPTAAGVPAYYKPFHDGEPAEGCRNSVSLSPINLGVPKAHAGCTALVIGYSAGNWWTQYGTFIRPYYVHGASTTEDAIAKASSQATGEGFEVYNDESHHPWGVQCEAPHGAVVALRKPHLTNNHTYEPLPAGVFDNATMVTGNSKADAVEAALKKCAPSTGNPHDMYARAGITSCEILDSW